MPPWAQGGSFGAYLDGRAAARDERGDSDEQTGAIAVARDRAHGLFLAFSYFTCNMQFGLEQRQRPDTGA